MAFRLPKRNIRKMRNRRNAGKNHRGRDPSTFKKAAAAPRSAAGRRVARVRRAARSACRHPKEGDERPADSLQKQSPGPDGHVFRKGRSGSVLIGNLPPLLGRRLHRLAMLGSARGARSRSSGGAFPTRPCPTVRVRRDRDRRLQSCSQLPSRGAWAALRIQRTLEGPRDTKLR
jgi:hypothetical protein